MDYSNLFVCLMGIGTVFVGLVCIILPVTLMSYVCRKSDAKSVAPAPVAVPTDAPKSAIRPELIAAVSAAIAEDMGTDISAIRIISMKQI